MKEFHQIPKIKKEELIGKINNFLKNREDVVFAYVFGSFLEAEKIAFRDVDIGVYLKPSFVPEGQVFDYECDLATKLSKETPLSSDLLDVKILNNAPSSFLGNVFSRGRLLFSKNDELLFNLIENVSLERISNEHIAAESLQEISP